MLLMTSGVWVCLAAVSFHGGLLQDLYEGIHIYAGSVKAVLESGLSFNAANSILKQEYTLFLSLLQSSGYKGNHIELPPPLYTVEERIKMIQESSCCPGGSITLLICPKCFTPHDKHYIFCQKCHERIVQRCQTKTCPANAGYPDQNAFCWHADYSTVAIKVMVRPVMCQLIDLIAFGKGKCLHGVHRSDILLSLQYIKENDLINTESSLNSYAFFSSLGETAICESMKRIHSNMKPSSLRNFLEEEKPFPLSTESTPMP